jgi:hypothetical protein
VPSIHIHLHTRRHVFGDEALYCEKHDCGILQDDGKIGCIFGEDNEDGWMIQNKGNLSEKCSAAEKPLKCVSESALCGVNELTPDSLSFF